MRKLRIMTYNIQSTRDYFKRDFNHLPISSVIKQINPDIIGLNEVSGYGENAKNKARFYDQIGTIAKTCGYPYYYFGKAITVDNSPYGNAIMSKYPINDIETIMIPNPLVKDEDAFYESRCVIKCNIENLNFLITHMGLAKSEEINAVNTILNLTSSKTILMGDFNMEKDNPIISPLFNKFKDSFELMDEPLLTFPSSNPRIKIDYILYTFDLNIENAKIIDVAASDHLPVVATIILDE